MERSRKTLHITTTPVLDISEQLLLITGKSTGVCINAACAIVTFVKKTSCGLFEMILNKGSIEDIEGAMLIVEFDETLKYGQVIKDVNIEVCPHMYNRKFKTNKRFNITFKK
jgi:hypothetical protein